MTSPLRPKNLNRGHEDVLAKLACFAVAGFYAGESNSKPYFGAAIMNRDINSSVRPVGGAAPSTAG